MKCAQCRPMLAALAGGDLAKDQSERCAAHLQACAECQQHLAELRETVSLLRRVGQQEPLPADFRAALHRRLAGVPAPTPPLGSRVWEALSRLGLDSGLRLGLGAAAVGVMLLIALRPWSPSSSSGGQVVAQRGGGVTASAPEQEIAAAFRVPSRRVAIVQLDFVADVALEDVQFEVTLPSELHFIDGGQPLAERTLQWRGSLALGRNPIPLAVRGIKPGRYRVTAQAHGPGVEVRHDILLEVVPS